MNRTVLPLSLVCAALVSTALAQDSRGAGASTDAEKLEAAGDNIGRMKAALKQVVWRADLARNERDIVKLNCVNEKLTQIKAILKVAEQADLALHESLATKDATSEVEFSKIAIARTKVDGLRAAAEQCIGQLAYMMEEATTVEVEAPPSLPGGDEPDIGLGVATRTADPTDAVTAIGGGATGGGEPRPDGEIPFKPSPIVRPPAASPYR